MQDNPINTLFLNFSHALIKIIYMHKDIYIYHIKIIPYIYFLIFSLNTIKQMLFKW